MVTIKASKDLRPISDLKSSGADIVRQVNQTGRPIVLTRHGRGVAVVLSLEEYEFLSERVENLELQRAVDEAEREIADGQWVRHAEVKTKIERWANGEEA